MTRELDCIIIGYNDPPIAQYESLMRQGGVHTEAYRDLQMSFIDLGGNKVTYAGLLNHAWNLAQGGSGAVFDEPFRSGDIPNLAAAYLTHSLRREGLAVEYINLFQQEKDKLGELLDRGPRAVAITTTFYILNFPVVEMVEMIRSRNPEVQIVVGGPLIANHVRNYPEEEDLATALDDLAADVYICESQGEATLQRLVECLKESGDLSTVPNLIYKRDGRFQRTDVEAENNNMNDSVIDWTTLADHRLGPTLQTRTARSCAFSCAFCNYPTRAGKLTLTSIESMRRELDSMKALGNVQNVVFIDDTFNVPLPRFKKLCRLMIEADYGFEWYSYFRCSNADEETYQLMADSGCKGVFLGIESGSPTILKNMNKRASIEQYQTGVQRLHDSGILTFGSFIMGFPGETQETAEETIELIRTSPFDYYRAQLWYNEPGTPISLKRDEYGIEGDGFVWRHNTMDSMEAMEIIERMFLTIEGATWLPQWSFDFWIIPYFIGLGVTRDQFDEQMRLAHRLLALEVAALGPAEHDRRQEQLIDQMAEGMRDWSPSVESRPTSFAKPRLRGPSPRRRLRAAVSTSAVGGSLS